LAAYRRVQAGRWLIVHGIARVDHMRFSRSGKLWDLPAAMPASGEPFQTSGCPDCNRPYYNERPGSVMYNYPRPLAPDEAIQAIQEMEIEPHVE
jgi:biotin synthase